MNIFWKSFYKTAGSLRKEVSTVAVMFEGKMLMGQRRDNGKMTSVGGHLDLNESPLDGAVRELFEESGIKAKPEDLEFIKTIKNKDNGYIVHGYRLDLKERPKTSMQGDPDQEVTRWNFVDTKTIPDEKLHVPRTSGNVLLPAMEEGSRKSGPSRLYKHSKLAERTKKIKIPSGVNGDGLQYYIDKARGDGVDRGALKTKIRE